MKRGERGGGERRFSALRTKIFFQGRFVVVLVIRRFIPLSDGAKEFLRGTPKEEEGELSQGERRKRGKEEESCTLAVTQISRIIICHIAFEVERGSA